MTNSRGFSASCQVWAGGLAAGFEVGADRITVTGRVGDEGVGRLLGLSRDSQVGTHIKTAW